MMPAIGDQVASGEAAQTRPLCGTFAVLRLLFIRRSSVIVQMMEIMSVFFQAQIKLAEARGDWRPSSFLRRRGGRLDDLEQVQVVRDLGTRLSPFEQRGDGFGQSVRPHPCPVYRLVLFPTTRLVAPDFKASRVPIVAEQIGGSFGAVNLQRRAAVALDRVASDDA